MIKVFGIWLVVAHIAYLEPIDNRGCEIQFIGDNYKFVFIEGHTCDQVAKEIKRLTRSNVQEGK